MSVDLTRSFPETLILKDGYVFVLLGAAAIEMRIGDQADPGFQDSIVFPIPNARMTQITVETVVLPTDANARLTQIVVEVVAKTPQGSLTGSQITIVIN